MIQPRISSSSTWIRSIPRTATWSHSQRPSTSALSTTTATIKATASTHLRSHTQRLYSQEASAKSRHGQLYTELFPSMLPAALLGSAVFLGLALWQATLAHEKWMDEAEARVKQLEAEIDALLAERAQSASVADTTVAEVPPSAPSKSWWW